MSWDKILCCKLPHFTLAHFRISSLKIHLPLDIWELDPVFYEWSSAHATYLFSLFCTPEAFDLQPNPPSPPAGWETLKSRREWGVGAFKGKGKLAKIAPCLQQERKRVLPVLWKHNIQPYIYFIYSLIQVCWTIYGWTFKSCREEKKSIRFIFSHHCSTWIEKAATMESNGTLSGFRFGNPLSLLTLSSGLSDPHPNLNECGANP